MQSPPSEPTSRPVLSGLVLWLVPAFCLFDTLIAMMSTGWRPVGTIEHSLLGLFILWLLSTIVIFIPSARATVGGHWRELLLLGAVSLVCWSTLEITASLVEKRLRPTSPFHTRGVNVHNVFTPDPEYLPGIEGPSHFTTGPNGVRAAALPGEGTVRVLCLGGSTTECVYLDDVETWPARLAGHVEGDVWVGNVGISGFDTQDHLRFVASSNLLEGVSALVVQPGINDLWRFLAGEVEAMDYRRFAPAEIEPDAAQLPRYRPWWTRSQLIQLYHTWRQPPPPPEQQEGIGGREYEIRRNKRAAASLAATLPSLEEGLAAYRSRIEAIIEACHRRDIPVLFTTQPVVWRADLPPDVAARCWFGWLPDGRYLTLEALREAMDRYNNVLRDACEAASVPCVDLSSLHGRPELFYDDCHFTEQGALEVARLVGPALADVLRASVQ